MIAEPTNTVTDLSKIESPLHQNKLTVEEKQQAKALAKTIDLTSDASIMNFGVETNKKLGDFSSRLLTQVKTKDADQAGDALTELVSKIKSYDVNQNGFEKVMSKLPIIGRAFSKAGKMISRHKTVESNLDEIVKSLDYSRLGLVKDNAGMASLYQENVLFIKENRVNMEALRIVMKELKEKHIPEMEKKVAENSNDSLVAQELSKLRNTVTRIDKKIYNMSLFEVTSIQSLPRLVLIQEGNKELMESIQFSVLNVIPLWREQIAESLALTKQKKTADAQNAMYELTNELVSNNSETSKNNTIAIAQQMERGIIDIVTLEKVNKNFMETLDKVIEIKESGAKNRIEAEKTIVKIKEDLSNKIKSINVKTAMDNNPDVKSSDTVDVNYEEVQDFTSLSSATSHVNQQKEEVPAN